MLQLVVLGLIEAEKECLLFVRGIDRGFHLVKHFKALHLVVEIPAIEVHIEYRFIEIL